MVQLIALLVGAVAGFVGRRALRRGGGRKQRAPKVRPTTTPSTPAPGRGANVPTPEPVARSSGAGAAAGASIASVGRGVGSALGRRKGLSAPELQRACFSEMIRHVQRRSGGVTVVPSRYVLRLHPDDVATVDEAPGWFADGLAAALRDAARDHGWELEGAIDIKVEADPGRHAGDPVALAIRPEEPGAGPTAPPPPPPPRPRRDDDATQAAGGTGAALVRTDTKARTELAGAVVTIGRGTDRTITIDDSRVSRTHASLRRTADGDWALTDDGSSNGTRLNGEELEVGRARTLHVGDVIEVGPVTFRFEAPHRPPPRASLGDRERTQITGDVLPPDRPGPA